MVASAKKTLTLALILLATALAGCADDSDALDAIDTDEGLQDIEVEATADTGIIRGVVVDEAIRPIVGAKVSVLLDGSAPKETTTNEAGGFGFDGIKPGSYFVRVSKAGFKEAQINTDVKAGVQNPAPLKILLQVNPSTAPYFQEFVFVGFIECSVSVIAVGFAACSGVGNDHFIEYFELDGIPEFLQSELIWDSTQASGDRMTLLNSAPGDEALLDNYVDAEGTSPLYGNANRTTLEHYKVGTENDLMIRVFNAPIEQTDVGTYFGDPTDGDNCIERPYLGGCTTGLGATIQQEFTVFAHAFFNYVPPTDWRFTESGTPPTA